MRAAAVLALCRAAVAVAVAARVASVAVLVVPLPPVLLPSLNLLEVGVHCLEESNEFS